MPQSGAPWDFLLLDDIGSPLLPDYKLYVFLNAFCVEPARREAIHAKLKRNGATALFVYAPGYLGPGRRIARRDAALTGIRVAQDDREGRPQVLLEAGDPLARGLTPGCRSGDEPDGRPAVLCRRSRGAGRGTPRRSAARPGRQTARRLDERLLRRHATPAGPDAQPRPLGGRARVAGYGRRPLHRRPVPRPARCRRGPEDAAPPGQFNVTDALSGAGRPPRWFGLAFP